MIVSRTPFRVSLFGGGSDYPAYYREHGGEVLGFAINKFAWISLRKLPPFFPHKHRIVHSQIELVKSSLDIQHPVVRELLSTIDCGIELHYDGDLPARSGLGSSSSFTVGMLNALHALKGARAMKHTLAKEAIIVERDLLEENVGSQDQIWAAYGGFNHVSFRPDDTFDVSPVIIPEQRRKELTRRMMLFFTGLSRYSSKVAGETIKALPDKTKSIGLMRQMVTEAQGILHSNLPLSAIGYLLHVGWRLKRELSGSVSTPEIDEMYEAARGAGALGGKLLGAGGGGFLLIFAEPKDQAAVRKALHSLVEVSFDISNEGSRIVVYEPDGL